MKNTKRTITPFILAALLPLGCTNDVADTYARTRAFLRFSPVTGVAPLYTAMNSSGMWCIITLSTSHYIFTGNSGATANYPRTATEAYGTPEYIAGFVVGTSSVPDMNMQMLPAAYDLACPACYEGSLIERRLVFSDTEKLACSTCGRAYDLTQGGIECSGKGGTSLYKYHITYSATSGGIMIIQN